MRTVTYTCAECGTNKKQSNHWSIVEILGHSITFHPWVQELADEKHVILACGEGCSAKIMSRKQASWKEQS